MGVVLRELPLRARPSGGNGQHMSTSSVWDTQIAEEGAVTPTGGSLTNGVHSQPKGRDGRVHNCLHLLQQVSHPQTPPVVTGEEVI